MGDRRCQKSGLGKMWLMSLVVVGSSPALSFTDNFWLKNKTRVSGSVIRENSRTIVIRTASGQVNINRRQDRETTESLLVLS